MASTLLTKTPLRRAIQAFKKRSLLHDIGCLGTCRKLLKPTEQPRKSLHSLRSGTISGNALVAALLAVATSPCAFAGSFDCLIEPTQVVDLASPVTGMIDKVLVKRGDRVSKGQTVALLESKAEQAAAELARYKSEQSGPVHMAETKIEFSRRKFDRRRQLADERMMAKQDADDAEAEHRLAESELQVARENRQIARIEFQQQSALLNLRTLRSPFDGVVADQMAFPGEVVEPGAGKKAVLKVAQLDPLRVQVILPKDVFGKLTIGMPVSVVPEIPANSGYTAKIKTIDRLIDAASGTFVVFLEMSNPKLSVPAGVKCKADFDGVDAIIGHGGVPPRKLN